ncbi:MAG: hypothetical protein IJN86_04495 [Clostridia bacterium]|nr:hypothetical protein [Clostridia bacterium]
MKKILALLLTLSLAIGIFCACGNDTEDGSSASTGEMSGEKATKENILGVWTGTDGNAIATYIFEEGGKGYLVSYGSTRNYLDLTWKLKDDKLKLKLYASGSSVTNIDYEVAVPENGLYLSYEGKPLLYEAGPYKKAPGADYSDGEIPAEAVGTWLAEGENYKTQMTLNADGTGTYYEQNYSTVLKDCDIKWCAKDKRLHFSFRSHDVELETIYYDFQFSGGNLQLIEMSTYIAEFKRIDGEGEGEEKDEDKDEKPVEEPSSEAEKTTDYPTNGGDDNVVGTWHSIDYYWELEADGTGRYVSGDNAYDAFWGVKEGELYLIYEKDGEAVVGCYSYIADNGKLYLTTESGEDFTLTKQ